MAVSPYMSPAYGSRARNLRRMVQRPDDTQMAAGPALNSLPGLNQSSSREVTPIRLPPVGLSDGSRPAPTSMPSYEPSNRTLTPISLPPIGLVEEDERSGPPTPTPAGNLSWLNRFMSDQPTMTPSQVGSLVDQLEGYGVSGGHARAILGDLGPRRDEALIGGAIRQYDAQGFAPGFARVPTQTEMGDLSERGRFYREQEALRDRFASRPQDVGISGMYAQASPPLGQTDTRDFKGNGYTARITPRADGGFSTIVRGDKEVTSDEKQAQEARQLERYRQRREIQEQKRIQAQQARLGLGSQVGQMVRQAPQQQQQRKPPGERYHDGFYAVQKGNEYQKRMQKFITGKFNEVENDYTYESAVDLALKLEMLAHEGGVSPEFAKSVSDAIKALHTQNDKPVGGPFGGAPIQEGEKPEPVYDPFAVGPFGGPLEQGPLYKKPIPFGVPFENYLR